VEAGGEIVWVAGVALDERFAAEGEDAVGLSARTVARPLFRLLDARPGYKTLDGRVRCGGDPGPAGRVGPARARARRGDLAGLRGARSVPGRGPEGCGV